MKKKIKSLQRLGSNGRKGCKLEIGIMQLRWEGRLRIGIFGYIMDQLGGIWYGNEDNNPTYIIKVLKSVVDQ